MKNLIRKLIVLAFLLIQWSAFSYEKISCFTPRNSIQVVIKGAAVKIGRPFTFEKKRSLASAAVVNTRITGTGFTKVLYLNGIKHTVHIENRKAFSDADDYLVIKSAKGHEITYPLLCE
jgi:hypothetical protein